MKIYFAGSIKGGRGDCDVYLRIINYLKKYGEVLTEHVGNKKMSEAGEDNLSEKIIYDRDIKWLTDSDFIIAEISTPSLGVGYEIAYAENLNKKVLCLYRNGSEKKMSPMIAGSGKITIKNYDNLEEALSLIDNFFDKNKQI